MTPKQQEQRAKMLAQCVDLMRVRHMALATERTYCAHIGSYIDWLVRYGATLPDTRTRLEAFLTAMAHRGCAASTQNQAFNALLFLYEQVRRERLPEGIRALRAMRPKHLRTALSMEQTQALLGRIQDHSGYPTRLITLLLYGCGLRVSEPLNLRVKDVQLNQRQLMIRGAKGGKDRVVRVPESLVSALEGQMKHARVVWEADQHRALPVEVPGQLARKYPKAPFAWPWAWVFPAHAPCDHPRTGERVRYRMHEANVQRAMKLAARELGLESLATPHVLRHCYATHVLASGGNVRCLQEAMGHAHLDTTMGYLHGEALSVRSPLDGAVPLPANVLPFESERRAA